MHIFNPRRPSEANSGRLPLSAALWGAARLFNAGIARQKWVPAASEHLCVRSLSSKPPGRHPGLPHQ